MVDFRLKRSVPGTGGTGNGPAGHCSMANQQYSIIADNRGTEMPNGSIAGKIR
jgi:hypothetical protein